MQKLAGIFYKIRSKLSQTCLNAIYFAFVHSHLLYGVELYANTGITHLSKLITLNNEILRIIQNKAYNAPVKELYTAYTTLPIQQLHKQQLLLLVHKYYYHKHLLPKIFCDYFQFNQGMYSYETRNKAGLHLRNVNTTFGQRCIKFKGSFLWNNLPNYIKILVQSKNLNLSKNFICNKTGHWNSC